MHAEGTEAGAAGIRLRALVVDDEPPLVQVVSGYLTREGFDVVTATDGAGAVAAAREHSPDMIVLDLMLPGIDGVEACRRIRAFSDAYIIMLTAKSDEVDKVVGLSVGADDYLTKPFSPRELVARVRAMLRRPRAAAAGPEVRRFGALEVDPAGREVRVHGRPVELTRTEFLLLELLLRHPRQVLTRGQIFEQVWGYDFGQSSNSLEVYVGYLRRKLGEPRLIQTVRGVGYVLR
jgi:DNA-binding response OmpR family regulator